MIEDGGIIGFSGTRHGMSASQLDACQLYLVKAYARGCRGFAHGCCVGADEQAALLARSIGYWLHGFPAHELGHPLRASTPDAIIEPIPMTTTPELSRNNLIVAASGELLAAPQQNEEIRRSGTWATIRAAWAINLSTTILSR